jgi:hypothetical protein
MATENHEYLSIQRNACFMCKKLFESSEAILVDYDVVKSSQKLGEDPLARPSRAFQAPRASPTTSFPVPRQRMGMYYKCLKCFFEGEYSCQSVCLK